MLGFQQLFRGTPVTPQTAFMEVSETPSHILSDDQGSTSLCSWEELSSSASPIPLLFYTSRGCFPPLSSFLLLCPAWPQFCFPSYALVAKSSSLRWNCFSPGLILYHSLFLHRIWQKCTQSSVMVLTHLVLPQTLRVSCLQTQSPAPQEGELRPFEPCSGNLKTCRKVCTPVSEEWFSQGREGGTWGEEWLVVYLTFKEMEQLC